MAESKWVRAGAALLTALCTLGPLACGGENTPKESEKPADSAADPSGSAKSGEAKPGDATFGDGPDGTASSQGLPEAASYLADSGFRADKNGFLFPNGDRDQSGKRIQFPLSSPGHLDKEGMQLLFGAEKVCLGLEEHGGECLLSPSAYEWMNMVNQKMNGGQCEGLAVFALSLFSGNDPVTGFKEGATLAAELDQDLIRGPVGYYFSYQFLQPFREYLFGNMMKTTPNEVLDKVIASFSQKEDPVALEFFQPGIGGHAVVPYAVEDKGNNVFHVRIWDNNFPRASRYIEFDKNKNSWLYSFAAINPSEDTRPWGGDASRNTIVATPVSERMKQADCPFCERETGIRMVMTAGGVNALVTDSQGRKIGMQDGNLVNEIPGAAAHPVMSFMPGEPPPEPIYELPANEDYDVELVGSGNGAGTVGVFGKDHAMVVEDINIDKGGKDRINLPRGGEGIDYTPGTAGRRPRVRLALGSGSDSYKIELNELKPGKGKKMGFRVDRRLKRLAVTDDGKAVDDVRGNITRFTRTGRQHSVKLTAPKERGRGVSFGKLTDQLPPDQAKPPGVMRPKTKVKARFGVRQPGRKAPPDPKKPDRREPPKKVLVPRAPAPQVPRTPPPRKGKFMKPVAPQ